jgi:hypothetical protein
MIRHVPSGCWQAVPTTCCGLPPMFEVAVYSRQLLSSAEALGAA